MKGMRPATQFLGCWLLAAGVASAQAPTIDLGTSQGHHVIDGAAAGARWGAWIHTGDLTGDFWRKELFIGAPDENAGRGVVRVFIGSLRTPTDLTTADADVVLTGGAAGDRFGAAADAGFVTVEELQVVDGNPVPPLRPRDLVIGAPGAASGRGRVYVFPGGFSRGATRTVADAVLTITGALPGDQLGIEVETGDLNGDGYREIILPVPSRGLVYVIDPRVAATSTIDLALAVPGTVISGLGSQISAVADDVTGDSRFDLAIGDPGAHSSRGVVYLLLGRDGALPGTMSFPTHADAQLIGTDVGDRLGTSLWVADIDDDRDSTAELIVGAPGGDGPGNSRSDAGEVHVIWGRPDIATAFTPGFTLYGAAAGYRLGTIVAAGFITRRTPADIVMFAPGANGGAGEAVVFYGRHTFNFPASPADVGLVADRRILVRAGAGALESLRVWEATGEGAEEVVVGVPSASTAAGSNAGRIYVALSPRLELSSGSLTMRVSQCVPAVQELTIGNPSVVSVPWRLSAGPSWVEIQPATGETVLGAPATVKLVAATTGLAPGTYSQRLEIRSSGLHLSYATGIDLQLTVDPPSPLASNAHVDFTADGCGDLAVFAPATGTWRVPGQPDRQLGGPGDIPVAGDYDGDLQADLAVFNRSTATWRFADGTTVQHGVTGDLPVQADYDGDGRMDIAVYRPSTATWLVRGMPDIQWGRVGDIPVPADYSGDGRADIAVFRPSEGTWHIRNLGSFAWGSISDVPVPGDYDGDGVADLAVFERATGLWRIRGQYAVIFGRPNDVPLPLDVDRDGRADLAVYRRASRSWQVYSHASGAVMGSAGSPTPGTPAAARAATILARTAADFDDDGRTDISVWRPGVGVWLHRRSSAEFLETSSIQWGSGALGDRIVPGDYDGDGVADVAVWRPGNGYWCIRQSSGSPGSELFIQWGSGALGDVPLAADFDGDGRTDIAVWRPGNGVWFVRTSSSEYANYFTMQWGMSGDVPVPGDYDGDGRADIAVWRPANGVWFIRTSSSGYADTVYYQWGEGSLGDVPAPADFDGDGRTDIAVWRPGPGVWFVRTSASGYAASFAQQWGSAAYGDTPVTGDFDGDGRADIAVWRSTNGVWFVRTSRSNYAEFFWMQWGAGQLSDVPVQ